MNGIDVIRQLGPWHRGIVSGSLGEGVRRMEIKQCSRLCVIPDLSALAIDASHSHALSLYTFQNLRLALSQGTAFCDHTS